jgi:two-component system, OmpR family, sensor kinase
MSITRFLPGRSPGIRTQLTLWYTAIFAVLILLFSFTLYTTLKASLASSVDTALQLRTQLIATGISGDGGKIRVEDVTGQLPGLDSDANVTGEQSETSAMDQVSVPSDVNVGILIRILNAKGQAFYITPAFRGLTVPSASVSQPLRDISWQGIVTARNGQQVRLYSIALLDNGTIYGVLQVGESLDQLNHTLWSIVIVLLVITPFVLLLGAFGSYWLARRAFRPIHRLTRTARNIKAGDLHRRVPVPQTKDEVQALALTINEMIGRLDQSFTQQRRFVADASHELRTPVTVIRSITEIALTQHLNLEEHLAVLQDLHAEAERLSQLINDLLALARADEGQTQLDRELVRLDLLAYDVAASIDALAVERRITLQIEKIEPATVEGDTARLILALMGLVDNALTYTNAGGTVTLNVEVAGTSACFSVRDTGIGIAPKDLDHIFERFYRADPARSRSAGGSGLGLAIVDWVVRAHGGSISVESQVGEGSIFKVTLPLAAPVAV